jgi:hypothetical protein
LCATIHCKNDSIPNNHFVSTVERAQKKELTKLQSEYDEAMRQHGEEIEKVAVWAKAVADHANVNFDLTGAIPRQLYG